MTSRRLSAFIALSVLWTFVARAQEAGSTPAQTRPTSSVHRPIDLSIDVLDSYVGRYELVPKLELRLFRQRKHLMAQFTGQSALEVFAASADRFFWKVIPAEFGIEKDPTGRVTAISFSQGGQKLVAKRISTDPGVDDVAERAKAPPLSPRIAALGKAVETGDRSAVDQFWSDLKDKAPLVEPIADDAHNSWVTFVWHGDAKTRRVSLSGGPPASAGNSKPLSRLADTDIWYRTERVPNDARFLYAFQVNEREDAEGQTSGPTPSASQPIAQLDPQNPREATAQGHLRSLLKMPDAPSEQWLTRLPGVAEGTLVKKTLASKVLNEARAFQLYLPAGYDPHGQPIGLLVLFDGPDYLSADGIPAPAILDNLIAKGKVPALAAVFVNQVPQKRLNELGCSDVFADFVAKELLPAIRKDHPISDDPSKVIVGGYSLGGLMSAYCALRHPDLFGNVLSQSGAYQWFPEIVQAVPPSDAEPGWLARKYALAPAHPIRFHLEAGRFENALPYSLLAENRRFRDVLRAKNYEIQYAEFSGGHDFQGWRTSFAEGLMFLTRNR